MLTLSAQEELPRLCDCQVDAMKHRLLKSQYTLIFGRNKKFFFFLELDNFKNGQQQQDFSHVRSIQKQQENVEMK